MRLVQHLLQAGYLEDWKHHPTLSGPPQGGTVSPWLPNVALHGMQNVLRDAFPKTKKVNGKVVEWAPTVVRYADDFVIGHRDLGVIQRCQQLIQDWLRDMGLELKPSKTRICHQTGFDFLGFTIRQYPVGKGTRGRPLGFKTLTKPSHTKVVLHQRRLAEMVRRHRAAPQEDLIDHLNPVIRSWCNYYRTAASKRTFSKVRHLLFWTLMAWARHRHPNEGRRQTVRRYWRQPQWTFAPPKGPSLFEHDRTPIVRQIKVLGGRSPFDGDWLYWTSRQGHYPGVSGWLAGLLKRQHGRCALCGLYFMPGSLPEVHHRKGRYEKDLAVLHRHCHDVVHGPGTRAPPRRIRDKDCSREEPYECESVRRGTRC